MTNSGVATTATAAYSCDYIFGGSFYASIYYHDGSGSTPVVGDTVYIDAAGNNEYNPSNNLWKGNATGHTSGGTGLYRFDNGIQSLIDERSNNQFEELAASIAGGIDFSNSWRGRIRVSGKKIDQELPGAIILYNDLQDEQMETQEVSVELDATYHKSPHFVRT